MCVCVFANKLQYIITLCRFSKINVSRVYTELVGPSDIAFINLNMRDK